MPFVPDKPSGGRFIPDAPALPPSVGLPFGPGSQGYDPNRPPEPSRPWSERITGGIETGMSALSSLPAGLIGNVAGLARGVTSPGYGTRQAADEAERFGGGVAQALTYTPRSEAGQEYTRAVGEALGPLAGAAPELQRLGALRAASSPGALPKPPKYAPDDPHVTIPRQMVEAGIKVPPAMSNPDSKLGQILSWIGGKAQTQQKASTLNAERFNAMAAEDLGLPRGTAITKENLKPILERYGDLRKEIDQIGSEGPPKGSAERSAYGAPRVDRRFRPDDQLRNAAGNFMSDQIKVWAAEKKAIPGAYKELQDVLNQNEYKPAYVQAKVRTLRNEAQESFQKGDRQLGAAQKATANALEDYLERRIGEMGQPDLIRRFREARTQTAKAYDYMEAANDLGDVSAHKLAKGDTGALTGNAATIARAGATYPKATQAMGPMGGFQEHSAASMGAAGAAALAGEPMGALDVLLGRPLARGVLMSEWGQRNLAIPQPPRAGGFAQGAQAAQNNPYLAYLARTGQLPVPPSQPQQ